MAPKFSADVHADAADLKSAPLSITTAGVNEIIAAVDSNDIIRVYRLALIADASNNLTFLDGANGLSGAIPLIAHQGFVLKFDTKPWFSTSAGNNLNINLTAGTFVNGILYYTGGTALAPQPAPPSGAVDSQPLGMP